MANVNSITIHTLDAIVDHVFDVTIDHTRQDSAVILHMDDSRIVISGEVLAAIDQARAEAAADRQADVEKDSRA